MISDEDLNTRLKDARDAALTGFNALGPIEAGQVTAYVGEAHNCFQKAIGFLTAEIAKREPT